ncbi:MAG: hypothetical protein IJ143_05085, partial [Neisseriaceae bacterium]|nr:hypothetical protein [Neisseriaceae bacterium]
MNKIYRTVYNETTNTWVAVEETAKSHRKSAGVVNESAPAREAGSLKKLSIAAAVVAMVSPFMAETAQADILCRVNNEAITGFPVNTLFIRTGPNCNRGETRVNNNITYPAATHEINTPTLVENADGSLVTQSNNPVFEGGTIDLGYRGSIYRVSSTEYRQDETFQRSGINSMPGTPYSGQTAGTTTNAYTAAPALKKRETSGAHGDNDIAIGTNAAAHGERTDNLNADFYKNIEEAKKSPVDISKIDDFDASGYYNTTGGAGNAIAIGRESQAVRTGAIAVGYQSKAGKNAIAIGSMEGSNRTHAITPDSIAIGTGAGIRAVGGLNTALDAPSAGGNSIALGNGATNWTYGNGFNDWHANTKNSIAIGYRAHTHAANAFAIGVSTDAIAERAFAIGTASTQVSEVHHGSLAAGQGSVVIGDQARVAFDREDDAIDEGNSTNIKTNDSVAIGTGSLVSARNALALGGGISYTYHEISKDAAGNPIAMDNRSRYYVNGKWEQELDHETFASNGAKVGEKADGAIALGGASADISGSDNTLYPTTAADDLTVDNYVKAAEVAKNAKRSIAIGGGAFVNEGSIGSVAIGGKGLDDATKSTIGTNAHNALAMIGGTVANSAENAIAVGNNAQANAQNQIAIGTNAIVDGDGTNPLNKGKSYGNIAIGVRAHTIDYSENQIAIGKDATTQGIGAIALGSQGTYANDKGSIAIGNKAKASKDQSIAIGQNVNYDRINDTATAGRQSIAIGAETQSKGIASIAIGGDDIKNDSGVTLDSDVQTGEATGTTATGNVSMAIGLLSQSGGAFSQAIGYKNTTGDSATNSIALGYKNTVTGSNSTAVGQKNVVTGNNSGAFGDPNNISGNNSYAAGNNNTVSTDKTFVLGNSVSTTATNSVFLGDSAAYVVKGTTTAGISQYTDSYTVGGVTYDNGFAAQGRDTMGVVSVGAVGSERRIQNMAAGLVSADSTDAINGSQLNAAYEDLQWRISAAKTGGDINTAIDSEVVGKYTGSKNGGNVKFIAGDGVAIKTSRDATTDGSLNLEFSMNTTTVSNTDNGSLKLDDINKGNSPATAASVVNAVNNSYWVATDGTNSANVKPSNQVNWTGADGVKVDLNTTTNTFTAKLDNTYLPTVVGDNTTAWVAPETDGNHQKYTVSAVDTLVTNGTGIAVSGGDVDPTTKQRTYTVALDQTTQDDINSKLST